MLTESHCRPGENSLANDIRSSAVDYILTACPCAARGVETLLNAEKSCCVIIMTGNSVNAKIYGRFSPFLMSAI